MDNATIELILIVFFIPLCHLLFGGELEDVFISKFVFWLKSSMLMASMLTAITIYREGWVTGLLMGLVWFVVSGVIMWGSSIFWSPKRSSDTDA
ncbi:hypothetical protein [Crenobacter cavernae]|uniref:Uncharacterized protein n=1 Tax=Crenobacter cavernae TaxID=2290923 RepID=A0ABY0FGW8_9NEIS|nr:hypothetical protein [Crenobacter cavernae]RXZ45550.1 hypothetical protein EBB06_01700 [Crenobacter cavernae]